MAMINCPECKHEVSDKATSCPECGYPLQQAQQEKTLADILVGKRWRALKHSLSNGPLEITFMRDSKFSAFMGADFTTPAQQFNGTWQAIGPQLFLDYEYNLNVGYANIQLMPMRTHVRMQFTQLSETRLLGVDTSARAWELQRIE